MSSVPLDQRIKKHIKSRLDKIDGALDDYFKKIEEDKLFKIIKPIGFTKKKTEVDMDRKEIEAFNEHLNNFEKEIREQEKLLNVSSTKTLNNEDSSWLTEQLRTIVSLRGGLKIVQQRVHAKLGITEEPDSEDIALSLDNKHKLDRTHNQELNEVDADKIILPSHQDIMKQIEALDKVNSKKMSEMTDAEFFQHKSIVIHIANDLEHIINTVEASQQDTQQKITQLSKLHDAAAKVDSALMKMFTADKNRSVGTQLSYFVGGQPRSLLRDSVPSLAFRLPIDVVTESQKIAHYQKLAENLRDGEGQLHRLQNISENDFLAFKHKVMNLSTIIEQMIQIQNSEKKPLSKELTTLARTVDNLTLNYDKADALRHPYNPLRRIPALVRGKPKLLEENWLPSATQAVKKDIVAQQGKFEEEWQRKMQEHFEPNEDVITPTQRAMVRAQKSAAAWIHPPLMPWEKTALDRKRKGYDLLRSRQKVYDEQGLDVQSGVEGMKRMLSGSAEVAEEFVSELALTQSQALFLTIGGPAMAAILLARGIIAIPAYVFSLISAGFNGLDQGLNEMITSVIGKHPLVKGEDGNYHYKLDTVGDFLKLGGRALAHGILRSVTWPTKWIMRGASAVFHAFDSGLSYLTKKPTFILPVLTIGGTAAGLILGATVIASVFTFGLPIIAMGVAAAAVAIGSVFLSWYRAREKAVELKNLRLNPIDEARLLTSQYEPKRSGAAQTQNANLAATAQVEVATPEKDVEKRKSGLFAKLTNLFSSKDKPDAEEPKVAGGSTLQMNEASSADKKRNLDQPDTAAVVDAEAPSIPIAQKLAITRQSVVDLEREKAVTFSENPSPPGRPLVVQHESVAARSVASDQQEVRADADIKAEKDTEHSNIPTSKDDKSSNVKSTKT